MLSSRFNPYTWDTTAQRVQSKVVSLQMKDDKGNTISVSNLKRDIEIAIPQTPGVSSNISLQSFFIKPSVGGKMQYHTFWVGYKQSSAFIQVKVLF